MFFYQTADVMKQLGANSIFAVDVGSRDSTESYNYGDKISGFWLLANKWSPWSETVKVYIFYLFLNRKESKRRNQFIFKFHHNIITFLKS